jgi:hypothetical protein
LLLVPLALQIQKCRHRHILCRLFLLVLLPQVLPLVLLVLLVLLRLLGYRLG